MTISSTIQLLTVSAGGTCGTWQGGSIALNANYATTNLTFTNSTLTWNAGAATLTITLGTASGTQATGIAASVPSYSATTSIQDTDENP